MAQTVKRDQVDEQPTVGVPSLTSDHDIDTDPTPDLAWRELVVGPQATRSHAGLPDSTDIQTQHSEMSNMAQKTKSSKWW